MPAAQSAARARVLVSNFCARRAMGSRRTKKIFVFLYLHEGGLGGLHRLQLASAGLICSLHLQLASAACMFSLHLRQARVPRRIFFWRISVDTTLFSFVSVFP